MISRRQGRGDAGVLFIRRGADDEANEDSTLIWNWNSARHDSLLISIPALIASLYDSLL